MWYRRWIKTQIKLYQPSDLTSSQKKEIKKFYASYGYKNVRTDWHRYIAGSNGYFSLQYVPDDIFHPIIGLAVNNMKQWPALLDKNLYEDLFNTVKQPKTIIKNINGFYYNNGKKISLSEANDCCLDMDKFVIKPSIESGGGTGVSLYITEGKTNNDIQELFQLYKKDFIVQCMLEQHPTLAQLNSSSLNTLRICSYLNNDGVHILSAMVRVGKEGNFMDNMSAGGIACGIDNNGQVKEFGYLKSGKQRAKTDNGVVLKGYQIPGYTEALNCVKRLHLKVPYFKIICWDIAIDTDGEPVFIEYNVYRQGIVTLQLANGPLFGEFFEELLAEGTDYLQKTKLF